MEGYNKKRHAVYMCTYHMIFVTKYRRPVINKEIGDFMKEYSRTLVSNMGGELLSAETDMDHIHLLVSLPPDVMPTKAVGAIKTQLSRGIHENKEFMNYVHQHLFCNAPLWSSSYFIATTGSVSMEAVKSYIESQKTDEHKRKYVHSGRYKKKSRHQRA